MFRLFSLFTGCHRKSKRYYARLTEWLQHSSRPGVRWCSGEWRVQTDHIADAYALFLQMPGVKPDSFMSKTGFVRCKVLLPDGRSWLELTESLPFSPHGEVARIGIQSRHAGLRNLRIRFLGSRTD